MNKKEQHKQDTGHKAKYCDENDSYYCAQCNIWLEEQCSDIECNFCASRSDVPLNTCGQCLVVHVSNPVECMIYNADNGYDASSQCSCTCHTDNCQVCKGTKGGVKGNENVINGIVMCDYCSVIHQEEMKSD